MARGIPAGNHAAGRIIRHRIPLHALIAEGSQQIARIEQAIRQGAVGRILDEFGGQQAVLKRSIALKKQSCRQGRRRLIQSGTIWKTERLSEALFRRESGTLCMRWNVKMTLGVDSLKGPLGIHNAVFTYLPCSLWSRPPWRDRGRSTGNLRGGREPPPVSRPRFEPDVARVFTRAAPPFVGSLPAESILMQEGSRNGGEAGESSSAGFGCRSLSESCSPRAERGILFIFPAQVRSPVLHQPPTLAISPVISRPPSWCTRYPMPLS